MASDSGQYDSALLGILQNEGKVAPFLDVILGFLYRRTDFFRVMKTENDKLGFPPGVAYKLLANIFKKYETLATKDAEKTEELKKSREEKKTEVQRPQENVPVPATNMEAPPPRPRDSHDERGKEEPSKGLAKGEGPDVEMEINNVKPDNSENSAKMEATGDDDEKEDPEQARQRKELQANPLTYNGAEREAYYWSQNITETDVRVKVPKSIVKGKQVKVDIQKKHVRVSKQESDGSWAVLVDSELSWEINTEESMWTLSPGEFVHINLEKKQERWWENVFVDEPKINTRKIDCSRPMTDLDDEAQAKIEEMMYNQRQKQMGLPQSHEVKTQEMLRKAWDAEGSPFKGQPFDPSRFSVDPSGMVKFKDS